MAMQQRDRQGQGAPPGTPRRQGFGSQEPEPNGVWCFGPARFIPCSVLFVMTVEWRTHRWVAEQKRPDLDV